MTNANDRAGLMCLAFMLGCWCVALCLQQPKPLPPPLAVASIACCIGSCVVAVVLVANAS